MAAYGSVRVMIILYNYDNNNNIVLMVTVRSTGLIWVGTSSDSYGGGGVKMRVLLERCNVLHCAGCFGWVLECML